MPRFNRTRLIQAATLLLVAFSVAHADDLTGLTTTDPKDLTPYCQPSAPSQPSACEISFVPMPVWARGVLMPPLPDVLKPMGRRTIIPTSKKAPQPLAPPKDSATTTESATPEHTEAGAKPTPAETPAMITVSPFLQWIQANPQAAAAAARQQAAGYQAPNVPGPTATQNGAPATPTAPGETSPYWLPPLIDAPNIAPTAVGGSAAIYSTPQR